MFGMLSNIRVNVSFIYGQEIVKESLTKIVGTLYNMFDASTMIFGALFFKYLSSQALPFLTTCFILSTISAIIPFMLVESPKYLI